MKRAYAASTILSLSENEKQVLELLPTQNTPLKLATETAIPRPTIYVTLEKLEQRGLVQKRKEGKRHYWELYTPREIEQDISSYTIDPASKRTSAETVSVSDKTNIHIYRGKEEIMTMLYRMIRENQGKRIITFQGDHNGDSWGKMVGAKEMNTWNDELKRRGIITEIVTSVEWFKTQVKLFGNEWVQAFEGRTARFTGLDPKFLDHDSQIFIYGDSSYILHIAEQIAIEIKNPAITKMIRLMVVLIQDTSKTIDGNAILRQLKKK